ncbi:hypothetical protein EVAR_36451_1 [Eumeta japonica]|uniref:Uncharacterized protein n=1 Tax=Eumeta variegata TaxID=151549 RepID=A0A4C1VSD9_EUMVA|nr:hypothetical protein EVAR_36451_1 [Eumeta japonica]
MAERKEFEIRTSSSVGHTRHATCDATRSIVCARAETHWKGAVDDGSSSDEQETVDAEGLICPMFISLETTGASRFFFHHDNALDSEKVKLVAHPVYHASFLCCQTSKTIRDLTFAESEMTVIAKTITIKVTS